jgi:tryptophan 2,3-dioxygenase
MAHLNYQNYLQLEKILGAQKPVSPDEHDEVLFIIIHQTYELWFKQLLHEGVSLKDSLVRNDTYRSLATFKRILKILKTIVGQVDILETMTPVSFTSFRNRLDNASGFQSWQFRCFEFLLGLKHKERIKHLTDDSVEKNTALKFFEEATLYDAFLQCLSSAGYAIPAEILNRDFTKIYEGDERIQELLFSIYKQDPEKALLCELFVDLDEGVQEWRYRHVKMVERTIGDKSGTGGSMGARYLMSTLSKPAFVDLWTLRARL